MEYTIKKKNKPDELMHYGVLGMKWGVRRYQRKDGTLTRAGKKHKEYALKGLQQEIHRSTFYKNQNDEVLYDMELHNKMNKSHSYSTEALAEQGRNYLNSYLRKTNFEMLKEAYSSNNISVGKDYVANKAGNVTLTDSGKAKEAEIADRAREKTIKDNKDLIKKYNIDTRTRAEKEKSIKDEYRKKINSAKTQAQKEDLQIEYLDKLEELD